MYNIDPYSIHDLTELQDYYDYLRNDYEDLLEEYNSLSSDYDELEETCANYKYLYEKLEQENYILENGSSTSSNTLDFFDYFFILLAIAFVILFFIGPFINFNKNKK